LEKPRNHEQSRLPKQTAFKCIITTGREHGLIGRFLYKLFHKNFVPEVQAFLKKEGLPLKAVLLLDNAPSHSRDSIPTSDDGLVIVKISPHSVTAMREPRKQLVIACMKQCYWADLLRTLTEEDNSIIAMWKKILLLDAINCICGAWSSVNPLMLL
jgi:hypothetical protein